MTFSVGILYSVQEFLKFVKETPIKTTEFVLVFQKFKATSPSLVLEVAESCNWINIDLDSNVSVTSKGNEIVCGKNMRDALRVQLKHLIEMLKPSWSYLIHRGRKESLQYFPPDVQQCFKEAELVDSYEDDVVKWWDIFASVSRGKQQDTQLEIGRRGEELSLEYEINRTGKQPLWQSIESNLAGFDILSCTSSTDTTPLRIEVKATTSTSSFTFYLTRNEWSVAEKSYQYCFHLWMLSDKPELYIIDKSVVAYHIPCNQGGGAWENVKITFDMETLNINKRND
ncbi:protein NO VEIN domain-containing protein [Bacillus inaquosorum]|uniref:DUF3883 domain-containing protein n=1 Tax=Bacillus inaquosorum TaxID=483913 RepID=UPI000B449016|nr:DUF3883 domain-containing protein [Bacillus inaquosorum]ARV45237.1 hypothetical protein BCV50_09505 [Bacillus subtilis]MEC2065331.1 DUF3883 domain-containing protein [Bacillus inaquosorum]MEC2083219.1 DUF3883 domain-containing protein [Bacillus inaquosorum]